MVLVRSIVTSSGEQEYKNLCMFFNINGVGKIIYGYSSVLLFTVVTIIHFVQWRNYVTILMCGHHYVLLKNLKHFIRWICIDEFHSFTSVEVWTHEETETCFCFKFSLYWNTTCCSRPLLYGYSLCSIFSQPPIPSDWWNELTVLPFPLLCMRAQQHGQNTNISPYQHGSALMQVCTKFCKAKGDFLFIYFAQVLSNIEC